MPHVEIKCYPGRTEEQKKKCADKIAEDLVEILGCSISSVFVAIKEIPKRNGKKRFGMWILLRMKSICI